MPKGTLDVFRPAMLVRERLNNVREPLALLKSSYPRQTMDHFFVSKMSEFLHQVENTSYVRRVSSVVILVSVAFLFNSVVGRLLEKLRLLLLHRMFLIPEAVQRGEDVVFGLNLAVGLINLTCTALLAWGVHDIAAWMLQAGSEASENK